MARLIRVLLVEDFDPWRAFYSTVLRKLAEIQVIAQVSDGLEAVEQAQKLQPDLILLDIGLPSLNGIEVARRIRKVSPMSNILFVSENRDAEIVRSALSAGGIGYVVKSDVLELLPAVAAVFEGKQFLSASLDGHDLGVSASAGGRFIQYNPYLHLGRSISFSKFLASIIEAVAADFGNVQVYDSSSRVLRIVAHHGFEREFLNYFNVVSCDEHCACGEAMRGRSRVIVCDVATDPLFSKDARSMLTRANVRSVQSTPLIDPLGRFIGMVSTHDKRSKVPTPPELKQIDNLAASFLAKLD